MNVTKKKALKYTLLPEVLPRIGTLFGTGFYHVAYLIAILFQIVRLLPRNHPYLNAHNLGRFGIRHVIAEAAGNLEFKRANLDQIIIFATILAGLVLLIVQLVLVGVAFIAQPVIAATFAEWFTLGSNPNYLFNEDYDIALMLLDRIFGVQNIFNSCVSTATPCIDHLGNDIEHTMASSYPYPMHGALHQLFYLYSMGISIVALMIILYFIVTIIGETAVSGTPFGQRFNKTWAPVRLILFFALLAPLNLGGGQNEGLNGAQLITLWTAKFGSNFASNAWGVFNTTTSRTYYTPEELIAIPEAPDYSSLAQFFTIVAACVHGEKITANRDIGMYFIREKGPSVTVPNTTAVGPDTLDFTGGFMYAWDILEWTNNAPIHVVIGEFDATKHSNYTGFVKPICGSFVVPTDSIDPGSGSTGIVHVHWMVALGYLGGFEHGQISEMATCFVDRSLEIRTVSCDPSGSIFTDYQDLVNTHLSQLKLGAKVSLDNVISEEILFSDFSITDNLVGRGWAGAAIWFNRIAEINGRVTAGMRNIPVVKTYPLVMETAKEQQMENTNNLSIKSMFSPILDNGKPVRFDRSQDDELASAYYKLFNFWSSDTQMADPDSSLVGNPVIDTINTIFGTDGLFNMRQPSGFTFLLDNDEKHPLALMAALGRSMVQASINNLGIAAGMTVGGGVLGIMGQFAGTATLMKTASSFLFTIVSATIMIGLILGYVLPLMPFIYFFFAVGGWVKSIFEAMVAMPIWALAHIRIDGEGMPGPGATNGYFLLLEIFLRPILILIGLLASIIIFGAMVRVLNEIFDIMVVNVAGVDKEDATDPTSILYYRGPIDELFYSIIYAAVVYMIGLSCFKLVDTVPNNILRWMGVSVATFKEQAGDPASQLSDTMYRRGNMMVGQASGAFQNNAGRLQMLAGGP